MSTNRIAPKRYRKEIEGLRAVAALLVAIYHIWLHRVSGGVDVFFVISGLLITYSLLSIVQRQGFIQPIHYIVKLLKRLVPTALTVAFISYIVGWLILPSFLTNDLTRHFFASLLFFENIQLAKDAMDYLMNQSSASPFQQFWALSIQFQFYIIWIIIFSLVLIIQKFFKQHPFKKILFILVAFISILSFTYSVFLTEQNQPLAYYHTLTRVWEFGVGSLLAIVLHKITLQKWMAWLVGWVGLIGLVSLGLVISVQDAFPGAIALLPVLFTIFILIAGNQSTTYSAYSLLSSAVLTNIGSIAFGFYLWHWPILIYYLHLFDTDSVPFLHGTLIIIISFILSFFTIQWIEKPIRNKKWSKQTMPIGLGYIGILVLLFVGSEQYATYQFKQESQSSTVDANHPGAMIQQIDQVIDSNVLPIPSIEMIKQDVASVYHNGCFANDPENNLLECEFGSIESETIIVLAGGSHGAHWLPMLEQYALKNDIKIVTLLKGRCRFSTENNSQFEPCVDWQHLMLERIIELQPDLVFTNGDIGVKVIGEVPEGFKEAWKILEDNKIPLLLMRDTPWYREDISICLSKHPNDPEACKREREDIVSKESLLLQQTTFPSNVVSVIDPSSYFCDDDYCYPIIGNVYTHFDSNHITATFSRSLAMLLENQLNEAIYQAKRYKKKER